MTAPSAPASRTATEAAAVLREDRDAGIRWLTLNRPAQRNALSSALMSALEAELEGAMADAAVRVIVLGGNGPVFSAGHDLRELKAGAGGGCLPVFRQCARLMAGIVRGPKPVIARVHGPATAAGCQLVAACDLALATPEAWFATPGVDIGLFCSTPAVALGRAVPRKAAMEMLLTGARVPAERARELGLINRVVPAESLDLEVEALAIQIAVRSPLTIALGKQAFYRQIELGLEDAYAHTAEVMAQNLMSHDAGEGIGAFLEKRKPTFEGR